MFTLYGTPEAHSEPFLPFFYLTFQDVRVMSPSQGYLCCAPLCFLGWVRRTLPGAPYKPSLYFYPSTDNTIWYLFVYVSVCPAHWELFVSTVFSTGYSALTISSVESSWYGAGDSCIPFAMCWPTDFLFYVCFAALSTWAKFESILLVKIQEVYRKKMKKSTCISPIPFPTLIPLPKGCCYYHLSL